NIGTAAWSPHGRHPVRVAFRWLSPKKEPLDAPVTYAELPAAVHPGGAAEVTAAVTAPEFLGNFLIEIGLAQDCGLSFPGGPRPVLIQAQVTGRESDDIDYYQA